MWGFSHGGIVSCGPHIVGLFSWGEFLMGGFSHTFFFTIVMSLRRGGAGRVSARSSRDELHVKIAISGSLS